MQLKYDMNKWKIESGYDTTINVVKFVAITKVEDVYVNVGHACWTVGKWIFIPNMSKMFPLATTSLNIIFINHCYINIDQSFLGVCEVTRIVPKDGNKVNLNVLCNELKVDMFLITN